MQCFRADSLQNMLIEAFFLFSKIAEGRVHRLVAQSENKMAFVVRSDSDCEINHLSRSKLRDGSFSMI